MTIGNAAVHFVDRHLSEGRAGKAAFIDGHGTHSYGDLARTVNQAGQTLLSLGVERGDRVVLCLNDSLGFPAMFFGALKVGAIPVPLNTLLTPDDYTFVLRDSRAIAAVVSNPLLERIEPALRNHVASAKVLIEGPASSPYRSLKTELANADDRLEAVIVNSQEARPSGSILPGSTGRPKGVIHRHGDPDGYG